MTWLGSFSCLFFSHGLFLPFFHLFILVFLLSSYLCTSNDMCLGFPQILFWGVGVGEGMGEGKC